MSGSRRPMAPNAHRLARIRRRYILHSASSTATVRIEARQSSDEAGSPVCQTANRVEWISAPQRAALPVHPRRQWRTQEYSDLWSDSYTLMIHFGRPGGRIARGEEGWVGRTVP